jgi:hypothetical protein
MSADHRKPVVAFVLLAFVAAALVGVQRAEAQDGRLLAAAVVGASVTAHGTLPSPEKLSAISSRARVSALGPVFTALSEVADGSGSESGGSESDGGVAAGVVPETAERTEPLLLVTRWTANTDAAPDRDRSSTDRPNERANGHPTDRDTDRAAEKTRQRQPRTRKTEKAEQAGTRSAQKAAKARQRPVRAQRAQWSRKPGSSATVWSHGRGGRSGR